MKIPSRSNRSLKPPPPKKAAQLTPQSDPKLPEQLIQRLAHLSAIFESSQDSIITKDLKGTITAWNPASEKTYGFSPKEVVGKPVTIIFPPEKLKEFSVIIKTIKKGEALEHYDTVRMRKDGKKIHVSISVSPIRDSEGKIIGATTIARDISERIELEKRKDYFISTASHELKTPLTTLKGFTQILLSKRSTLDPQHLNFIVKMNDQIEKLTQLVNDLLDVSAIKSGKIKLKKERFKFDELVKDITTDMQHHTTKHRILVKTNSNKPILADRYRLSQVLINLISNAIKYSPKADKIIVRSTTNGHGVKLSIQDFGIGIFQKDQPQIFESFYQAKTKIRESYSGLGLGLYISAEIIKQHKGKIWVESIKGQGSIFYVQLPYK